MEIALIFIIVFCFLALIYLVFFLFLYYLYLRNNKFKSSQIYNFNNSNKYNKLNNESSQDPNFKDLETMINNNKKNRKSYVLALHGGVDILHYLEDNERKEIKSILQEYLNYGIELLEKGEYSYNVVEEVIKKMENDYRFNAGGGSVNLNGFPIVEMDACIMKGDKRSGTVQSIYGVKNPITVAKTLLFQDHPLTYVLSGKGAYEYALKNKIEIMNDDYFEYKNNNKEDNKEDKIIKKNFFDTVGCVCKDMFGDLCAGTSTGGINGKLRGRVGDVGIVGTGTYAENDVCAISFSGIGEYIIKNMISYDVACRIKYCKKSLKNALEDSFKNVPKNTAACIAIDSNNKFEVFDNTNSILYLYKIKN